MLPVLLAVVLSGIDYAWTLTHKAVLQDAADSAAIAGAKQLSMSDAKRQNVEAVVTAMVKRYIADNRKSLTNKKAAPPIVTAKVSSDPLQVEVSIIQNVDAMVGGAYGLEFPPITVKSVARISGRPNICVLALSAFGIGGAVWLTESAQMTGNDCAVFSNSTLPGGIIVRDKGFLRASHICSAGGYEGGGGNFEPLPMPDCPTFADPLAGRMEPMVGACVATDLKVNNETRTLFPGTYCGGLEISGTSRVQFAPGTYVIKDGPFKVTDRASVIGKGTGFYLTGNKSALDFDKQTSISLTAPTDGEMAGLLFFGARNQSVFMLNRIRSNNARVLLGTIYFPRSSLQVDADASVSDQSAYTAIIVNRLLLMAGPNLVLNSNYDQTNVPVPRGIRGTGQPISLVQ